MREFTWLIWDIVALFILVTAVGKCAGMGFLRTVAGFVTNIASAIGAWMLSRPLAAFLYNILVRDIIQLTIIRRVTDQLEEGLVNAADWMSALPGWMTRMVLPGTETGNVPVTADSVIPAVEAFVHAALEQPVLMILRGVFFFLLFALFSAIARRFLWLLGGVNRLPLVGWVNSLLGGVLGAGWGVIILYLISTVAWIYIILSGGGAAFVNEAILSRGYLFSFFFRLAA